MDYKGCLYIVSTPIGNMQDMTWRAVETLGKSMAIFCEDTRQTKKLLNYYEIPEKLLIPLNDFNEEMTISEAINLLSKGDIALVSDSGTPLISDPGYKLVNEAKKRGIRVIPIPGPSAVITALSASGLPTDKFIFLGFLPKTPSKAKTQLNLVKDLEATVAIYESPYRVVKTLKLIESIYGPINATVAREMTKIHEEILTKPIADLITIFEKRHTKGEFVILFSTKL